MAKATLALFRRTAALLFLLAAGATAAAAQSVGSPPDGWRTETFSNEDLFAALLTVNPGKDRIIDLDRDKALRDLTKVGMYCRERTPTFFLAGTFADHGPSFNVTLGTRAGEVTQLANCSFFAGEKRCELPLTPALFGLFATDSRFFVKIDGALMGDLRSTGAPQAMARVTPRCPVR